MSPERTGVRASSYAFGSFCLDPKTRLLSRDGEPVPLTPKALVMLCVLVENRGHIVEKGDLIEKVWPDAVVEDGNLTFNIHLIRRALGEWEGGIRYIETVPRRGYRFVAPVTEPREGELSPTEAKETPPERANAPEEIEPGSDNGRIATRQGAHVRAPLRELRSYILIGVGALAIAGVLTTALMSSRRPQVPEVTASRQLSRDRREKGDHRLLTDGSRVYFCEAGAQDCELRYVPVEGGDTVSVPSPFTSIEPYDLSPDGSELL